MEVTRILIVDDSVIYRKILTSIVHSIPNVECDTAANASIAFKKIESKKHSIVLLDYEMPGMNGLDTFREIKKRYPTAHVIMISTLSHDNAGIVTAFNEGLVEFVQKTESTELKNKLIPILKVLISKLPPQNFISKIKKEEPQRQLNDTPKKHTAIEKNNPCPIRVSLVGIGVSTGGPPALMKLIPKLTKKTPPVFVVQHMPAGFTASLARQLDQKSILKVKEAEDGEFVQQGFVYIAPGGHHMEVVKSAEGLIISLNKGPLVKSVRPSVDVLFNSMAKLPKETFLSVVLTGMGNDGLDGVAKLNEAGSYNLAQNERSCVVYGMPRAIIEAGLANEILDLDDIPNRINQVVGGLGQ